MTITEQVEVESAPTAPGRVYSPSVPTILWMTRRNLVRVVRMPSILVPMAILPLFFVIAFTGSFDGISHVSGYPTENVINWVAAFAILEGASFAGMGAAGAVATDLDNGFIDRLLLSPIRRGTILVAPLLYSAIRALVPITLVLIAAALSHASMPGGVLGVTLAYLGGVGGAVVIGAFGLAVVLRMDDIRAMSVVQTLSFMVMFPSIGQVPLVLLSGWMHSVARINPVTNILRMSRQGFLGPVTWANTWPGLVALTVGALIFGAWASYELERRNP